MKPQLYNKVTIKETNLLMNIPFLPAVRPGGNRAIVLGNGFFMESLASLLQQSNEFEQVIFCPDIDSAQLWLTDGQTNHLYIETDATESDTLFVIQRACKLSEKTTVLVFTNPHRHFDLMGMMLAGARAFIRKNAGLEFVSESIRAIKRNGFYLCPGSSDYFINDSFNNAWKFQLTFRQLLVLKRMATGAGIPAIAAELAIPASSIYADTKSMMLQFKVDSLKSLAAIAVNIKAQSVCN